MRVAIHQPNYFPWSGYFFKMYLSDTFVFHDTVTLSTRTYARRTRILKDKAIDETRWLTVPLKKHASNTLCHLIEIDHTTSWALSHLNKIRNAYAGSKYYSEVFPKLTQWLLQADRFMTLAELNIFLIQNIVELLNIQPKMMRSSTMNGQGSKSELNIDLIRKLSGTTYISGIGARQYQSVKDFNQAGISLVYHDIGGWLERHTYDQGAPAFVPGMSVIDTLMHLGPTGVCGMFDLYTSELKANNISENH